MRRNGVSLLARGAVWMRAPSLAWTRSARLVLLPPVSIGIGMNAIGIAWVSWSALTFLWKAPMSTPRVLRIRASAPMKVVTVESVAMSAWEIATATKPPASAKLWA